MKRILVLAGALLLLLSLALIAHADAWDMTFKQEALDSRVLVIEAPGVDTIVKNWGCDGVNVIAKVATPRKRSSSSPSRISIPRPRPLRWNCPTSANGR